MSGRGPGSLVWAEKHLRLAVEAANVALWSWNVDSNRLTMDERAFALWGMFWSPDVLFDELSARVFPADQDRVRLAFEATLLSDGPFEIDFRIIVEDAIRWVSARGQGGQSGILNGTMFGIFLDMTERKKAEESSTLLAGEMSHRVKNLLSIAVGLTEISHRGTTTSKDMAQQLTARLMALGRAHDLVRPDPEVPVRAALLGDLVTVILAPYDEGGQFEDRIRIAVDQIAVGETAATSLALVIHELATNSLKHGALSASDGVLEVKSRDEGAQLQLLWIESGGPLLQDAINPKGFGNRMIERSIQQQFGGSVAHEWRPTGLIATLTMRKDRLAA